MSEAETSALPAPSGNPGMKPATSIKSLSELQRPSKFSSRPSLTKVTHKTYPLNIGKWTIESSRDWAGWGKILGFYAIYYSLLIGIANGSLACWELNFTPTMRSRTQAHLKSPGMEIYPVSKTHADGGANSFYHKPTDEKGHTLDLANESQRNWYIQKMDDLIDAYQTSEDPGLKNYDTYDWIKQECGANYGFEAGGSPCFIISLNNIVNWKLAGLSTNFTARQGQNYDGTDNSNYVHFHCDIYDIDAESRVDLSPANDAWTTRYEIKWIEPSNSTIQSASFADHKKGCIHTDQIDFKGLPNGKADLMKPVWSDDSVSYGCFLIIF